jgi:hypothetical protein
MWEALFYLSFTLKSLYPFNVTISAAPISENIAILTIDTRKYWIYA